MAGEDRWCVVTGGRGFAARHLVEMLIRGCIFSVRVADMPPKIELQPYEEDGVLGQALRAGRARYISTDLRDKAQVMKVSWKLGTFGIKVPKFTPSRIRFLSCSRSFNCSKASDRLGYKPVVPLQEGIKRTIESYFYLRAENKPKREGPSKAYVYLGRGKVAGTLLWKDKRQTLMAVLVLVVLYCNFIASGCTVISAVSRHLTVASIFLFIHGCLPGKMLQLPYCLLVSSGPFHCVTCLS